MSVNVVGLRYHAMEGGSPGEPGHQPQPCNPTKLTADEKIHRDASVEYDNKRHGWYRRQTCRIPDHHDLDMIRNCITPPLNILPRNE